MQRSIKKVLGVTGLVTVALLASSCAGGTASNDEGDSAVELTYMADDGTCATDPLEGIDFAAASELVASFEQPADSVLATEPLREPVSPDTTAVYLNNGTPVASIFQQYLEQASQAAGIQFVNVDTGSDAQSINSALNSVVEMKPDIVFDQSIDAIFFQDQLEQLKEQGAVIVYGGQLNAEEFGLVDSLGGAGSVDVNSDVLAAGAVTLTCGTAKDFVFYSIPELPSSGLQAEGIEAKLAELCPECTLRVVDISIADPSPADKIVSDLQAHPETQFFIAMGDQFQLGLQEKAALAGLENAYGLGQSSLPPNFQQIADGQQMAGYAVDFQLFMWLQVDEALRRMQDMEVPYLQDWMTTGQTLSHFITIRNADKFLGTGYVAYPGMEEEFLTLWGK